VPFSKADLALDGGDLREAQRGALYAVAAHVTWSDAPAQVVLPTGVGKTLVACLLPYLLDAQRVLVVTPARIVKDQVAHEFATQTVAKSVGALAADAQPRPVLRADRRCENWDAAARCDAVVGTPQVLSHAYEGVAEIPRGMFDLVIFDEAHHLPAPNWDTLHRHLADVRTVLLTATPFRRDGQRLPGELAFTYPLRRAISAGGYQPVKFNPVPPVAGPNRDAALATAAAAILRSAEHVAAHSRLLARTDRRDHATALVDVYAAHGVTLKLVLDRTSGRTVRQFLKRMGKDGDVDGLIVVGAMTEGFDFPRLKVAVYHRPHRALGPTLQFIGRLARAGDVRGELIAFAEDVSGETATLFRNDAVWETLVPDLVDTAVDRERQLRAFTSDLTTLGFERHKVSALAIAPPRSTHIFRLTDAPDFTYDPSVLAASEVIERFRHTSDRFIAFVTRRRLHPRFMRNDVLDSIEHHLHVATWVEDPGLLFVSTDLASALKEILTGVSSGRARPVSAADLSRLLAHADLERCFSVGARPTSVGTAANESYRTLAGPRAELSLSPSEARARVLGHVMGRMTGHGSGSGTFGFSAKKAKLWEPTPTDNLADFRAWCEQHAAVLRSSTARSAGNAALNVLGLADRLAAFPNAPAIAVLPKEILSGENELRFAGRVVDPLTVDVTARRDSTTTMRLVLTDGQDLVELDVTVEGAVTPAAGTASVVDRATWEVLELADLLDEYPVTLLFGDGTWVLGEWAFHPPADFDPLPTDARLPVSWAGVNTTMEFVEPLTPTGSVAGKALDLLDGEAEWIIQDHLPGELADFIALRELGDRIRVDIVHCKKPGGNPGTRVVDIQELLAQAMRSMYLATAGPSIWNELARRLLERNATKIVKGTAAVVNARFAAWTAQRPLIAWQITCVQPGVDDSALESWTQGNALMTAAYDACKAQGVAFRLIDAAP
jgi:superfamily II DNA or RNA helicase